MISRIKAKTRAVAKGASRPSKQLFSGARRRAVIVFVEMVMRKVLPSFVAAALLGACAAQSQVALMTPDEIRTASVKAETPAHISTVQFKELGDTKRGEVANRLIRDVWGDSCKPTFILPQGYFSSGRSRWAVRCVGSALGKDYEVDLPERADGNARVLKCFKSGVTHVICDIVGRPAGQASEQPASALASR